MRGSHHPGYVFVDASDRHAHAAPDADNRQRAARDQSAHRARRNAAELARHFTEWPKKFGCF